MVDLATWLEVWNVFLAVQIQIAPDSALVLVKYQAIMTMLFSSYPAGVCLKYDSTFRQAVARDRSYLTPWDQVKEDILVWCATRNPFRGPKQFPPEPGSSNAKPAPAGPTGSQSAGLATHTSSGQEICKRFNFAACTRNPCSFARSVGFQAVARTTPGGPVPRPLHPLSDNHIRTPLRLSEFEKELQLYPDKAWSSRLLSVAFLLVLLALIPLIYLVI